MLFWFSNDTFSIIDALGNLILVFTGSTLIICFCHKLTNYKKSRRYKSDATGGQPRELADHQHHLNGLSLQRLAATGACHDWSSLYLAGRPNLLYDPYNTDLQHLPASPFESTAPPLFHSAVPGSSRRLIERLALEQQLASSSQSSLRGADAALLAPVAHLIVNPVYSSAGFHQALSQQPAALADDRCPSYEEAIRAANTSSFPKPEPELEPAPASPSLSEPQESSTIKSHEPNGGGGGGDNGDDDEPDSLATTAPAEDDASCEAVEDED